MRPAHLSTILAALSRSEGLVPDPDARETFAAAAKAAEAMPKEARVVIVGDNPAGRPLADRDGSHPGHRRPHA